LRLSSSNIPLKSEMDFFPPAKHPIAQTDEKGALEGNKTLVDLEDEPVLNNTAAMDKVSSDLGSLETRGSTNYRPTKSMSLPSLQDGLTQMIY
jgi:hypothetical protein